MPFACVTPSLQSTSARDLTLPKKGSDTTDAQLRLPLCHGLSSHSMKSSVPVHTVHHRCSGLKLITYPPRLIDVYLAILEHLIVPSVLGPQSVPLRLTTQPH